VEFIQEPYATMIYTAVFSGLRVSELIGIKWGDVHTDALTVDERYRRGDWSVTKTAGSSTTIGIDVSVVARIHRLKTVEVEIAWGGKGARKRIKLVRADGPKDLVFKSVRKCATDARRQHLVPASQTCGSRLGSGSEKGDLAIAAHVLCDLAGRGRRRSKAVQGQMRHSRISTTMDVYAQYVSEAQRRAVAKMMDMVEARI